MNYDVKDIGLATAGRYKIEWADFIKPVAGFYSYKGKLMTMPFNSSSPILWYNTTHYGAALFIPGMLRIVVDHFAAP